jgi:hypothetical protein
MSVPIELQHWNEAVCLFKSRERLTHNEFENYLRLIEVIRLEGFSSPYLVSRGN